MFLLFWAIIEMKNETGVPGKASVSLCNVIFSEGRQSTVTCTETLTTLTSLLLFLLHPLWPILRYTEGNIFLASQYVNLWPKMEVPIPKYPSPFGLPIF